MSRVFFDVGVSLDGFMAGENRGPQNPMGGVSAAIHKWMLRQKAFWEFQQTEGGTEDGPEGDMVRQTFARAGAYIMGKRMFEEGEVAWPEDLYKAPVYVLTNEKRAPWVQKGSTTFYFVNEGIERALEMAKENSGGKDVRVQGGGSTIQQYFNAGLVDDFTVHIAPVALGTGLRLFEGEAPKKLKIQVADVSHSQLVTHISYSVTRNESEN